MGRRPWPQWSPSLAMLKSAYTPFVFFQERRLKQTEKPKKVLTEEQKAHKRDLDRKNAQKCRDRKSKLLK